VETKLENKRKLLFEFYDPEKNREPSDLPILNSKIEKLKNNFISKIFIVHFPMENSDIIKKIEDQFQSEGFPTVVKIIESLNDENIYNVRSIIDEVYRSFEEESCLVFYYGSKNAASILGSFYIYNGESDEIAISRISRFQQNYSEDEKNSNISFLKRFYRYYNFINGEEFLEENENEKLVEKDESISENDLPEKNFNETKIENETNDVLVNENIEDQPLDEKQILEEIPENKIEKKDEVEKEEKSDLPIEKTEDAVAETFEETIRLEKIKNKQGNKNNKFYQSLRFKLVTIISSIIIVALSGMIFTATYFFKNDNKNRVENKNLTISKVVSMKVKSDFETIIDKSKFILTSMNRGFSSSMLLNNDEDFLFFGVALKQGNKLIFKKKIFNDKLIKDSQLKGNDLLAMLKSSAMKFSKTFRGEIFVQNFSPFLNYPVFTISFPYEKNIDGSIHSVIISVIKISRFLKAFKSKDITKTFMVNYNGDLIAHPDSSIILSGANYMSLPIVKNMIKSKINNGQIRYFDENKNGYLASFQQIPFVACGVISTVKESDAYKSLYAMQKRNIFLMMIIVTIAILIVYFFGKSLTTPLVELVYASEKIKTGDYHVSIRPSTHDEIGDLTYSFIQMGKGLEEREKMKDAFGKFVNEELAEQVLKGGIHLGGERKMAAVFFSDIRSFTAISEKLEPEEVVEFLNDYMTRMVKCVNDTKGMVDKYIGDAIMAEWGVPVSHGNDTEHAVNAALLMRQSLIDFNKGRGGDKKPVIKIGCGINSGPVLAGQIGSEDRMEYTVIGDAVNLASRIEGLNKPFGTDILISQDSYDLVKDIFAVEKMAPIRVKGKSEPQQIYAVLGRFDDPTRPKTLNEVRDLLGIEHKELPTDTSALEKEVKYEILES